MKKLLLLLLLLMIMNDDNNDNNNNNNNDDDDDDGDIINCSNDNKITHMLPYLMNVMNMMLIMITSMVTHLIYQLLCYEVILFRGWLSIMIAYTHNK